MRQFALITALGLLTAGLVLSLSIFPEAFVSIVFNDTGESLTALGAALLPGFLTAILFSISIALVVRCREAFTPRRTAAALAAVAVLAAHLALVPFADQGFRFDIALYRQSACAPHSTAFLC